MSPSRYSCASYSAEWMIFSSICKKALHLFSFFFVFRRLFWRLVVTRLKRGVIAPSSFFFSHFPLYIQHAIKQALLLIYCSLMGLFKSTSFPPWLRYVFRVLFFLVSSFLFQNQQSTSIFLFLFYICTSPPCVVGFTTLTLYPSLSPLSSLPLTRDVSLSMLVSVVGQLFFFCLFNAFLFYFYFYR